MNNPKVSVLVPTYNYARFLPETIESVLEQDFTDFELLISDDASTDNSAEVIRRYAARDKRIRVQIHPTRLGMVENWNWCLEQARGEYIKYVFGDDKLSSRQTLRKFVAMLDANLSVSLAVSARNIIDEHSQRLRIRNNLGKPGVHRGRDVLVRCLEKNVNLIGEPTVVMFRKTQACRGFDLRYRQLPDLEMWFHLLEKGDAAYTIEPLCSFRKHGLQQTELNRPQRLDEQENAILLAEYYSRPWLRTSASRHLLFTQVYALRKVRSQNALNQEIEQKMTAALGGKWYYLLWLHHKTTKLVSNLRRFVFKHILGQPVV